MAKKTKTQSDKSKKRSPAYSKNKGNRYEQKIAKELRELGFTGVVTSRSESKSKDDDKIDLIDKDGYLPIEIQLKSTQSTPSYFKIREESSVDNKKFAIIWAKQEKKETNICTVGECAIISKELLYELIKPYAQGENK